MTRRLVVTVGTSLLSSASWRGDAKPLARVSGYQAWVEREAYRKSPGCRQREGHKTAGRLAEALAEIEPQDLLPHFDWNPHEPLRYSGELTTLIRMFQDSDSSSKTFGGLLKKAYHRIDLLCPDDQGAESYTAARHLEAILGTAFGHGGVSLTSGVLRSPSIRVQARQFQDYLRGLQAEPVDLVVTGGYKMFALMAGRMMMPGWCLYYLHESQMDLVREVMGEDGTVSTEVGGVPTLISKPAPALGETRP